MSSLSFEKIKSKFIGRYVYWDNLAKCAQRNGTATDPAVYIVYSCGFLYKPELMDAFGVTPRLKGLWERRGTEFNVCVYIRDGKIDSCAVDKYREDDGARPSGGGTLKCTDQDLRIARRILEYITPLHYQHGPTKCDAGQEAMI